MVKYFLLIFIIIGFLYPQDGGIPGYIFLYGTGGRASQMGGAYTSVGEGVESIYYNPAGLNDIILTRWFFSRSQIFASDVKFDVFGFAKPVSPKGSMGFMGLWLHSPSFKATDRLGNELGDYNFVQFASLLNYSLAIKRNSRLGLNFKAIYSRLYTYSAFGYGIDLGFNYWVSRKLKTGFALLNAIPPRLKYLKERETFSPVLRMGISGLPLHSLLLSFDLVKPFDAQYEYFVGGEFSFSDIVYLRGGFSRNEAVGGVGLRLNPGNREILFNYTYSIHYASRLAMCNTHRVGVEFTVRTERIWVDAEPDDIIVLPDSMPPLIWFNLHVFPGKDITSWRLVIKSVSSDIELRSFGGAGSPPLRIPFDFLDNSGNFIPEGRYMYEFEVTYSGGKTKFVRGKLFRLRYGS